MADPYLNVGEEEEEDGLVINEADVERVIELGPDDVPPDPQEEAAAEADVADEVEITEVTEGMMDTSQDDTMMDGGGGGGGGGDSTAAVATGTGLSSANAAATTTTTAAGTGIRNDARIVFTGHSGPVYSCAIHPGGQLACTGGGDDKAFLWSTETGETVAELTGHKDSVTHVGFTGGDGNLLATGSMDGEIRVWSVETHEVILELDCGDDMTWMQWHPKAPFLLAGSASGSVHMWDAPGGNLSFFAGHTDAITDGAWLPTGRSFVTVSEDGNLIEWSPKRAEIIAKVESKTHHAFHKASAISCVTCYKDGALVATGAADQQTCLVNVKTRRVVTGLAGHTDVEEAVGFSASEPSLLATASLDGSVRVFHLASHTPQHEFRHEAGVIKLLWHPTDAILVTASLDASVRIWDARAGSNLAVMLGNTDHVLDICMDPLGKFVISGGEDGSARVFDIPSSSSQ